MRKLTKLMVLSIGLIALLVSYSNAGSYVNIGFEAYGEGWGWNFYYGSTWYGEDFSFSFYTALSPYGEWIYIPPFGRVWRPWVEVGWRPYSCGYWAYTSYGWTWIPYEPWGWIPHHYGRWVWDPYYGWIWIPGYTFAPAWVTWYVTYTYIGWAPLPPENYYSYYYSNYYYYSSYSHYKWSGRRKDYYDFPYEVRAKIWTFVPKQYFAFKNIVEVKLRDEEVIKVFSTNKYKVNNNPPTKEMIERFSTVPIKKVSLNTYDIKVDGKTIKFYKPKMDVKELKQIETEGQKVVKKFIKIKPPKKKHYDKSITEPHKKYHKGSRNIETPKSYRYGIPEKPKHQGMEKPSHKIYIPSEKKNKENNLYTPYHKKPPKSNVEKKKKYYYKVPSQKNKTKKKENKNINQPNKNKNINNPSLNRPNKTKSNHHFTYRPTYKNKNLNPHHKNYKFKPHKKSYKNLNKHKSVKNKSKKSKVKKGKSKKKDKKKVKKGKGLLS